MNNQKTKRNILIIVAAVCVVFALFFATVAGSIISSVENGGYYGHDDTVGKGFAKINIIGTIQAGNEGSARVGYDHAATLDYIDKLMEDESNTGIFLDVDSGGGTVYESDETYLKLMEYKEKTGRPVHAYFNSTAASGAYYISAAADYISANKNCWTGSIGVIISTTNLSGLYEKLGIEEILITSGGNKGMGSSGSVMTDEHRAIYQSLVDEAYDEFVRIVCLSRGYTEQRCREIADGRVYTAKQALEIDLIDKIESYDEAIEYMEEVTESEGYYEQLYYMSPWEEIFADIESITPKSDMQVAAMLADNKFSGVPLYMYTE